MTVLRVDVEHHHGSGRQFGFYRIMLNPKQGWLPSYWMFNGTWHHRTPPNLNPPRPWIL